MKHMIHAVAGGFALALVLSGPTLAADSETGRDYGTSHPDFNQLDIDGNGVLSKGEAGGRKGLLSHYWDADKNRDNAIDRSEFAAFEAMAPLMSPGPIADPVEPGASAR